MLVNAAGHTSPKYGERYYEFPRGSTRRVDLQPYRRFFGALLLQQVPSAGVLESKNGTRIFKTLTALLVFDSTGVHVGLALSGIRGSMCFFC